MMMLPPLTLSKKMLLPLTLLLTPHTVTACGDYQPAYKEGLGLRVKRSVSPLPPRQSCDSGDPPPPTRQDTTDRLSVVREEMKREGLAAYLVPSGDQHQSEYVAEEDKRRKWVSGFSGSSGFAVVTTREKEGAAVWVDGRYYIQGENQLDCNWLMMRKDEPETPAWWDWLYQVVGPDVKVGSDPTLTGADTWLEWEKNLGELNISLTAVAKNLIDSVWTKPRSPRTGETSLIQVHDLKYAGVTWEEKVSDLRSDLESLGAEAMVVTGLDEVAWLLNLRGRDIPYSPVFKAYMVVTMDLTTLYVDTDKVTDTVRSHLNSQNCKDCGPDYVQILDYSRIFDDLQNNVTQGKILLGKPWAYSGGASYAIYSQLPPSQRLVSVSPIMLRKAQKNSVEVAGMKAANLRDAVALIAFSAELEEGMAEGEEWDEIGAASRLKEFRSEQKLFQGNSFKTISAYGDNGAVIHYKPVAETNTRLGKDNLFLLDSGAQYLDGTTDVTRTFHFGSPSTFQREAYTRVLMGAVDLAKGVFRAGTTDTRVDILARGPLYSVGLNYRHGTGHGIGAYGLVHESPVQLRVYKKEEHELKVGYFFSDEPGLYIEGQFGIRLETVLRVVERQLEYSKLGFGPFFGFEPVCLVPFEPELIETSLLSREQVDWLNLYSERIREEVGPKLLEQKYEAGYRWMMARTEPLIFGDTAITAPLNRTTRDLSDSFSSSSSMSRVSLKFSLLLILCVFWWG